MENITFITNKNFLNLLKVLANKYKVVFPKGEVEYTWHKFSGEFDFNNYRAITSIRQFFTPSREIINRYFDSYQKKYPSYCIVGAKACDLLSLKIQDYVFLENPLDSDYKFLRDNNLIISSDCTSFKEVCFCLLLEVFPYPISSFDLNISFVENGYIVEIGSDKGRYIFENNKDLFNKASDNQILEKNRRRNEIVEKLSYHLKSQNLPSKDILYNLIKNNYENNIWQREAFRCVECGACVMNCPTCHCFLLFDSKVNKSYLRAKTWDGCQYKNFSVVAGGANPLKFRKHRLRNRYIKKFEFFWERIHLYACTGCGRCIDSCPAKIDIREIFKEINKSEVSV